MKQMTTRLQVLDIGRMFLPLREPALLLSLLEALLNTLLSPAAEAADTTPAAVVVQAALGLVQRQSLPVLIQ